MREFAVAHLDEIPELDAGDEAPIRPVRHHFGITSFGVNAWTAKNAGDLLINDHDENDPNGQEELYLVARGRAVFELDGERRDAPAGTLVFAPPNVTRSAFAEEAGTTVLAVGAAPGEPYLPVGWELWYPLRKRYLAGEHAEVIVPLRELVAANPGYALLQYNLACLECLVGERTAAVERLRTAIELAEMFRGYAKEDSDLDAIRDDPAVRELLAN